MPVGIMMWPTVVKVTALKLMTDDIVTYKDLSTTLSWRVQTEISTLV